MKKLILSLVLITMFFSLVLTAEARQPIRWLRNHFDHANISYNSNNDNLRVNVGFSERNHNSGYSSIKVFKVKPWMVYAAALLKSPAPTFRSMPAGGFYRSNGCTFVSKTPVYSHNNIKKGYAQGYYRC